LIHLVRIVRVIIVIFGLFRIRFVPWWWWWFPSQSIVGSILAAGRLATLGVIQISFRFSYTLGMDSTIRFPGAGSTSPQAAWRRLRRSRTSGLSSCYGLDTFLEPFVIDVGAFPLLSAVLFQVSGKLHD